MKDADIKIVGLSSNQTKGKTNWKILGAIIGIIVLAVGVVAGIVLVRQQQNISEKAAICNEQCPGSDGSLYNCHPPESDGSAAISLCNVKGRVEFCGTQNYCCPAAGGAWTTNMSACAVATATSTATAIATATATSTVRPTSTVTARSTATATATTRSTATATATSTAIATSTATTNSSATASSTSNSTVKPTSTVKPSATATAAPIPVTGASWPTILGTGFGIMMILVSLALAL